MSYRNDLAALSARKSALETEVRDRQRELADASRLVAELEARRTLPVLDNLRVAAPCPARWADMAGDDRVRHCTDCAKSVYNLSDMTRDEAEALIVEHEGKLCVRYFQRADGTILLKDCVVGVRRRRLRQIGAVSVAAGLAGAALGFGLNKAERMYDDATVVLGRMPASPPADPWGVPDDPAPTSPPPDYHEVAGGLAMPVPVAPEAPRPPHPKYAKPAHKPR
ncbi:MAG TPA: hypothetical protein VGC42_04560 [Kofleriaceae bacterium]